MALSVSAADNYLHLKTADGWEVLNLDSVDRLTFSGNTMTVADASGVTVKAYDRGSLENMYVNESAGIGVVEADTAAPATFSCDAASRRVTVLADGTFCLYGTDGTMLTSIGVKAGEVIDFTSVKPGIVIMKLGDYTLKALMK